MSESSAPDGPSSIFDGTLVELTQDEVAACAASGAAVLVPTGVVEAHGPHLSVGVDTLGSHLLAWLCRQQLAAQDTPLAIAPPFYWGVNSTTSAFPGSFRVRPEVSQMLLEDILRSLVTDGFEYVFLVNHHGDPVHAQALLGAVQALRDDGHTGVKWLTPIDVPKRFGQSGMEAHWLLYEPPPQDADLRTSEVLSVHAHDRETAMMRQWFPDQVREDVLATLEPTDLDHGDLARWRRGGAEAKAVTPLGYFGDPHPRDPDLWRTYVYQAVGMAAAVRDATNLP